MASATNSYSPADDFTGLPASLARLAAIFGGSVVGRPDCPGRPRDVGASVGGISACAGRTCGGGMGGGMGGGISGTGSDVTCHGNGAGGTSGPFIEGAGASELSHAGSGSSSGGASIGIDDG